MSRADQKRAPGTGKNAEHPGQTAADIRRIDDLDHETVASLNFLRRRHRFVFRRHFRQGLRSHVIEVLIRDDWNREREGIERDGLRRFPDARPVKMLRIFRRRFSGLDAALEEIRRLRVVEAYLPRDLLAQSEEFIASYRVGSRHDLLLCGLQEVVSGDILDPWRLPDVPECGDDIALHAGRFVGGAKRMVLEGGTIPDLAGVGNLFVTPEGRIRLVDINNISRLPKGSRICLDDRGYPACDKSIEALALMERHLCGAGDDVFARPPYDRFLRPERMRQVRELEERFVEGLKKEAMPKLPKIRYNA